MAATIDVMIVYSNQTAAAAGAAIGAQAQQAVDTANLVYANSGITTRLRLVYAGPANYDESGDFNTELNRLTRAPTATWTTSPRFATRYGADLVSLMVENGRYCGLGWIGPSAGYGFSVVNRGCASANLSFPHELGHDFGARHDTYVDAVHVALRVRSWLGRIGQRWRDVMAYNNACAAYGVTCTRIPYFSNPNMTYSSDLLGSTSTADTMRVHNQNALTVANFPRVEAGRRHELQLGARTVVCQRRSNGGQRIDRRDVANGLRVERDEQRGVADGRQQRVGHRHADHSYTANAGGSQRHRQRRWRCVHRHAGVGLHVQLEHDVGVGAGDGRIRDDDAVGGGRVHVDGVEQRFMADAVVGRQRLRRRNGGLRGAPNTGAARSANLTIGGKTLVVSRPRPACSRRRQHRRPSRRRRWILASSSSARGAAPGIDGEEHRRKHIDDLRADDGWGESGGIHAQGNVRRELDAGRRCLVHGDDHVQACSRRHTLSVGRCDDVGRVVDAQPDRHGQDAPIAP